jgi:hypothetical protein
MTMNLCWVFGLSLLDFLARRTPSNHNGKLREPLDRTERFASPSRRSRIDRPVVRGELTRILRENRYAMMSFSEICREKLGRRDTVIRQTFPNEARAIGQRYLENRRLMGEVRRNQFCASIQTVATLLHSRDTVPNHKTISAYVDAPSRLRSDWAIEALKKIRMELGYEDPGEQLLLPVCDDEIAVKEAPQTVS